MTRCQRSFRHDRAGEGDFSLLLVGIPCAGKDAQGEGKTLPYNDRDSSKIDSLQFFREGETIGIEPSMIATSVNLIVAQRLARKSCERCRVEAVPTAFQMNVFKNNGFSTDGHRLFRGEGCEECGNTGFKGRVAIYEVMPLWEELREMIVAGSSAFEIRAKAEELGFNSLQAQGFDQVTKGVISPGEWMRVFA